MKSIAQIFIIIYAFVFLAWADNFSGLASNLFLRAQISPRPAALSGAYTAIGNDVQAIYYNPAGFVQLKSHQASFTYVNWFENIRMQNVSLAFKLDPRFAVAFGFSYMGMPEIQGKDRFGQETEKLHVNSSILQLNLAYKIYPSFFLGMGVKYFRDNLAGYVGSGMALDFGFFMETIIPRMTIGASVQNFGNKIRYDQQEEAIPLTYRLGIGYTIPQLFLRVAVDGFRSLDQNWRLATGLEFFYKNFIFLRMGNNWLNNQLNDLQPTFGAGFNPSAKLSIDYTFYNHQQLGFTHRIGLSFRFGKDKWEIGKPSISPSSFQLRPPQRVYAYIEGDVIKVEWSDVPGAQYQVYVRKSNDKKWVKAHKQLLWAHEKLIKKPRHKTSIDIAVASIIDGKESSLSRIVTLEINK